MLRHKAVRLALVAFVFLALATPSFAAGREKVLFRFNYTDGFTPFAPVIFDEAGNLYGTTSNGGKYLGGNVYELSPTPDGNWKETVLYYFCRVSCDGAVPDAGLVFDTAGNLYGTGGFGAYRDGVVFELSPNVDGTWTETVLHSFGSSGDGIAPEYGSLLMDAAGNLYGTTALGGTGSCEFNGYPGCGTVFELSPGAGGQWTEKVLYSFQNDRQDGNFPYGGLVADSSGNLYGTTSEGGFSRRHCFNGSCGTVFELTPGADGTWKETILYYFEGHNGSDPISTLTVDPSGNLYGVTTLGGRLTCGSPYGCGTVFELTPNGNGTWTEQILRSFHNGRFPRGKLVFDAAGSLYGTTWLGGRYDDGSCGYGCGTVFKITPSGSGQWTETTLHSFGGKRDGWQPGAGVIFDSAGNLYGTTVWGGRENCPCGTVFELTP